jgi:hypothetical protein
MKETYRKIQYNGTEYILVFNLNVMESIQEEYGTLDAWSNLCSPEGEGEANAKAIKFGITEMLNEGIDIQNEENGTDRKPLTQKQVGRMITEIGLENMADKMKSTVSQSTQTGDESKNA